MIKRRSSVDVLSLTAGSGSKLSGVESDGEDRPRGLTLGGLTLGGVLSSDRRVVVEEESTPGLVVDATTGGVAIGTFCGMRRRPAAWR